MKIAVITDIHGNFSALKKTYKTLKNDSIDKIIFLGDYITDCPYPNKTMRLIFRIKSEYECVFLKGNREEYLDNIDMVNKLITSTVGSIIYTKKHTKEKYLDFLKRTADYYVLDVEGMPKILFAHASVTNKREIFRPDEENTKSYMASRDEKYFIVGHSHRSIEYGNEGKKIINPGALGICEKKNPDANYLLIESVSNDYKFTFKKVSYSKFFIRMAFVFSILPIYGKTYTKCIRDSFRNYDNIAYKVIRLGNEYKGDNPISEKYYKKAYLELCYKKRA